MLILLRTFVLLMSVFLPRFLYAMPLDLTPYKGQVVLVDFWASWCLPCHASFPWLKDVQKKYANQGLIVLTINLDERRQDAETFLAKYPSSLAVLYDPKGEYAQQYGLETMPTSLIVDRKGAIRYRHNGFLESKVNDYEDHIRTVLRDE